MFFLFNHSFLGLDAYVVLSHVHLVRDHWIMKSKLKFQLDLSKYPSSLVVDIDTANVVIISWKNSIFFQLKKVDEGLGSSQAELLEQSGYGSRGNDKRYSPLYSSDLSSFFLFRRKPRVEDYSQYCAHSGELENSLPFNFCL